MKMTIFKISKESPVIASVPLNVAALELSNTYPSITDIAAALAGGDVLDSKDNIFAYSLGDVIFPACYPNHLTLDELVDSCMTA